jgi:RES domain-containing protein
MFLYRIIHKKYSASLFASGMEGRWNSAGKKVIYCAESIALAFLENMIRRQGIGFNDLFKIMFINVPETLAITTIEVKNLDKKWRDLITTLIASRLVINGLMIVKHLYLKCLLLFFRRTTIT